MKTKTMITLLTIVAAVSASSSPYEEQLSIHTLAPRGRSGAAAGIHVADALLSDWEGDHWVSLDADLDKVSLSWTTDAEHITFQVGSILPSIGLCNLLNSRPSSNFPSFILTSWTSFLSEIALFASFSGLACVVAWD